jgi:hypothetical protein
MDEDISIKLSKAEALVLFEFLSRYSNEDKLIIEDQAEQRALWNLQCVLEKELMETFIMANYSELLASAREGLRDKD